MDAALSQADLHHFEAWLRARSVELRSEIRDVLLRSDLEQYTQIAGQVHDAEEEALADLLVDVNLAEIDHRVQGIRDVEAALRRIKVGTYGVCVACRQPIARERLEAYPTATRCLRCQANRDRTVASEPTSSL